MSRRRVLYVSPLPPPAGGIATWTRILLERGLPAPWVAEHLDTRSDVPAFSAARSRMTVAQLRRWRRILSELSRILVHEPPDLVHINCSLYTIGLLRDVLCMRLSARHQVPCVMHYRGDVTKADPRNRTVFYRYLLRLLSENSSLNIVLDSSSKEFLQGIAREGTRVVKLSNFYDDQEIRTEEPTAIEESQRPRIAFVGGLTRDKGADVVISAAEQLPHIDFVLLGRCYAELEAAVDAAPANVECTGEVAHSRILSELATCHAMLLPTKHIEGFPNAICEAMASGLPIIACPVGAIGEMVDDERGGILLQDREVATVVAAIRHLVASESRRVSYGRHNLLKAREEYSFPVVCDQLVSQYTSVLDVR